LIGKKSGTGGRKGGGGHKNVGRNFLKKREGKSIQYSSRKKKWKRGPTTPYRGKKKKKGICPFFPGGLKGGKKGGRKVKKKKSSI